MAKEKSPRFEQIDTECEKYKKKIEKAYKRFEEFKDVAKASLDSGEENHHSLITLYNEVYQNFVEILLLRKSMTWDDYFSDKKNYKKSILSLQLEVFADKREKIEKAFFTFSDEKKSDVDFPFFVYLDCALRPHLNGAIRKSVIDEVKCGIRFSEQQVNLMTKVIKFLDSYYSYMDYDKISDDVLIEFMKRENEKNKEKVTFESLKNAYIALRSKGVSTELLREREAREQDDNPAEWPEFEELKGYHEYPDDEHGEAEEEYDGPCYGFKYPEDGFGGMAGYDEPVIDDVTAAPDEPVPVFESFENEMWLSVLERCEIEFAKENKPKNRSYISYMLSAYFINKCMLSCSDGSYKKSALQSEETINSFIENMRDYSFFSREIIDLFYEKKDRIEEKDVAELLGRSTDTLRYHFYPFMERAGLSVKKAKKTKEEPEVAE